MSFRLIDPIWRGRAANLLHRIKSVSHLLDQSLATINLQKAYLQYFWEHKEPTVYTEDHIEGRSTNLGLQIDAKRLGHMLDCDANQDEIHVYWAPSSCRHFLTDKGGMCRSSYNLRQKHVKTLTRRSKCAQTTCPVKQIHLTTNSTLRPHSSNYTKHDCDALQKPPRKFENPEFEVESFDQKKSKHERKNIKGMRKLNKQNQNTDWFQTLPSARLSAFSGLAKVAMVDRQGRKITQRP